jgi:hypothetical protein
MPNCLGHSAHADRNTRMTLAAWPEAMSLEVGALYSSTSVSTLRDWVADGLLKPLRLPGTFIRAKNGTVITRPRAHSLKKIIVLKADIDELLRAGKAGGE